MRRPTAVALSRLSSFDHPTGRAALEARICSHPFNHELELFVPLSTVDADTVLQPQGTPFFHSATLELPQLLELGGPPGLGLCALSASCADGDDAFALAPDGVLLMTLSQETYQLLGVPGCASDSPGGGCCVRRRIPPRFTCSLPLLSKNLRPGTRRRERVAQCFSSLGGAPLCYLLASVDKHGCSLEPLLPVPVAAAAHRYPMQPSSRHVSAALPPLERAFGGDAASASRAAGDVPLLAALCEWIGGLALGVVGHEQPDGGMSWRAQPRAGAEGDGSPGWGWEEVSAAACPGWPSEQPSGWLQAHRWRGLIAPEQVLCAVRTAQRAVTSLGAPWAALTVSGFSGLALAARESGVADSFLLLILPKDRYLLLG